MRPVRFVLILAGAVVFAALFHASRGSVLVAAAAHAGVCAVWMRRTPSAGALPL